MLRRRAAATALYALPFGGMLCAVSADAGAQTTPQAFLERLYRPYLAADFKGQSYTAVDQFFVPDLARAIERDMREAARRKEVPTLDGDPFVDAQDWEITKLSISATIDGTKATGRVGFDNLGKPVRLTIDLLQTTAGWRIADIEAPSGSLRALYKLAP